MRIETLDLIAYGPFTDLSLDLSRSGVHLITGSNEAGKSTTLEAITDVLFGIPHRSTAAFVHEMKELRLGTTLRHSDGTALSFVRLKRAKDDLRRADGTPLEPGELARFLGAVDRDLFRRLHGIDHDELVAGGQALAAGRGELGELLFSAGMGATHLRRLLQEIAERADSLFKPGGSRPELNAAITRYQSAISAGRDAALRPADYADLTDYIARLDEEIAKLHHERDEVTADRSMAQLLIAVLPNLRERRRLLAATTLSEGSATPLRVEMADELTEARSARESAREDAQRELDGISRLDAALADVAVDQLALDTSARIDHLRGQRSQYVSAIADLAKLTTRHEDARRATAAILAELDPTCPLDDARRRCNISTALLASLRDLADEATVVQSEVRAASATAADFDARRQRASDALALLAIPPDTGELTAALEGARVAVDLSERVDRLSDEGRALRSELTDLIDELGLRGLSDTDACLLDPPKSAIVESFRTRRLRAASRIEGLSGRLGDTTTQRDETAADLRALLQQRDTPTAADLTEHRHARDSLWQTLRSAWVDATVGRGHSSRLALPETADGFEAMMGRADETADRLRADADTVARRQELERRSAELSATADAVAAELSVAEAELHALDRDWAALWAPLGIHAGTESEMLLWLAGHTELCSAARRLDQLESEIRTTAARVDAHRDELRTALEATGIAVADSATLASTIARATQVLESTTELREQRRKLTDTLANMQEEASVNERRTEQAAVNLEDWRCRWTDALERSYRPPTSSVTEVRSFIDHVRDLAESVSTAEELGRRLEQINDYLRSFDDDTSATALRCGEGDRSDPAIVTVDRLVARLDAARASQHKVTVLTAERDTHCDQLEAARHDIEINQRRIDGLISESGLDDENALAEAAERAQQWHGARERLEVVESELRGQSNGRPAETLETLLEGRDETSLQRLINSSAYSIRSLDERLRELSSERGELRARLQSLDGSAEAAAAATDAEFALSQIESLTDEYVALELATALLEEHIADFRERHQGPILERALPWFEHMTGGAFRSLRTESDGTTTVLEAVRADGSVVHTDQMSDGTRDQLYLALRLGAIVETTDGNEPFPLVLDDVLLTFDDDRCRATFEVLGSLPDELQVLVFSHHRHLAELAAATLGERLIRHELNPPARPAPVARRPHR